MNGAVSYRGTNFPKEFTVEEVLDVIDKDIGEGWSIFTGLGPNSQPLLAQQFYKAVTGRDFLDSPGDPIGTGITLTGHSLGGGVAANDNTHGAERRAA